MVSTIATVFVAFLTFLADVPVGKINVFSSLKHVHLKNIL